MLLLAAEDPDSDIALYINSPGGSVTAGMAIFDTMEFIPCDVATYAHGPGRVDGPVPAVGGQRGKRYALPHCRILMHQPSAGVGGTAADIAIQAELFSATSRRWRAHRRHTGQTVERIIDDSDRDRWFTAQEALEYGFVDHVISRAGQLPGDAATEPNGPTGAPDESPDAAVALHPAVVHRAHELRGQGVQPVQQAVRGAHHLPRRADRRRVRQRRDGAAAVPRVGRPGPRHHACTSTRPAARSPR